MKSAKILFYSLCLGLMLLGIQPAAAQCAMCSATAEAGVKDGNTEANGLNKGILYLLAAPYIAVAAVGYVWYKKYRRKNVEMNMGKEKFHLN
ncbi:MULTISPECIES: hypothetical protein [unclassified Mucilaginibacter]|uniref:hypothetical protein n=1 Tax=unclassified Mucilaginibacter TaxID=2617802 RepID=UPI0031F6F00E